MACPAEIVITLATRRPEEYGDPSVAAAPNPPEVWRNRYRVVFHLEGTATPIADSRQSAPGTPANLKPNASIDAKLGKGIDFDGNINEVVSFTNPLNGNGSSTISVWVSQQNSNSKDALVALGNGSGSQARWFYGYYDSNEVALGLYANDWTNTNLSIENTGWRLLHWTYDNQVSRLYRDGQLVGNPFTHPSAANTQGNQGWLGNAKSSGFETNAGLNGILDEVRIADTDRSPGWIAAEFTNQSNPGVFMTASMPLPIP